MALPDWLMSDGAAVWDPMFTERNTLWYFCEPPRIDRFIRQPADTYSNLGFLFAGILMLVYAWQDGQSTTKQFVARHRVWSQVYGGALVLTFLGSAFFHASLTWLGEWIDLAAVFAAGWLPILFNFHRLQARNHPHANPAWPWLLIFAVLWALSCYSIFRIKAWYTFPTLLVLIGMSSALVQWKHGNRRSLPWMLGSIGLTFFAIMWFVFDIRRVGCDPDSWFQPHAMWHLTDAAAAGSFYGFTRTVD